MCLCSLFGYDNTKGKYNDLRDFAEQIDRLFARNSYIYKDALAMVVTNVPKDEKVEYIKIRLTKMIDQSKDAIKNGDILRNTIQNLIVFRRPDENEVVSPNDRVDIVKHLMSLKPILVSDKIDIAPSVSPRTALAAISLYTDLNETINSYIEKISDSILSQYEQLLHGDVPKIKLQDAVSVLEKVANKLPSVIRVDELGIIVESQKKYFEE